MAKIKEITDKIQTLAPLESQESWDNSGWQIRLQKKDIKKVMLCVSVTDEILKQAICNNCDMIVAHHPLFSRSILSVSYYFITFAIWTQYFFVNHIFNSNIFS